VDEITAQARQLVEDELVPTWERLRQSRWLKSQELGIDPAENTPPEERCLSPSDFGFHNALLQADGTLKFFDFEYAGWDDPAKTVCDFLCQPALPIPPESYERCVAGLLDFLPNREGVRMRIELLLPVYQIKWICIMLNEFRPVGHRRRGFAVAAPLGKERLLQRLDCASQALAAFHQQ
jgi:hypothetical protein